MSKAKVFLSERDKSHLCSLYMEGAARKVLMEMFNISNAYVDKILVERETPRIPREQRRSLTRQQEQKAIAAYCSGISLERVARLFGVSYGTIHRTLRLSEVERRTRVEAGRTYRCNESFFSTVQENEKAAYWAGFIAADGCISECRSTESDALAITLAEVDIEHLRTFTRHCEATHPVNVTSATTPKGLLKNYATIKIFSNTIARDLGGIGITPRKTFTLRWPSLPDEMLRHFLRGYIDGDGGWSINDPNCNPQLCLKVTGNIGFITAAQAFLAHQCNLQVTKLDFSIESGHKGICSFRYGGNRQNTRIASFLYDGATVFLPRKYEKIKPLLKI